MFSSRARSIKQICESKRMVSPAIRVDQNVSGFCVLDSIVLKVCLRCGVSFLQFGVATLLCNFQISIQIFYVKANCIMVQASV